MDPKCDHSSDDLESTEAQSLDDELVSASGGIPTAIALMCDLADGALKEVKNLSISEDKQTLERFRTARSARRLGDQLFTNADVMKEIKKVINSSDTPPEP